MMSYEPGTVVEVPFPFIDRPERKRRPALVVGGVPEVALLAMITSAKRSSWSSDVTLSDWKRAGLRAPSVVRLKVFSIEPEVILTARGVLSPTDRAAVAASLRRHLGLLAD